MIDHALALHLGRVGGEHGHDERPGKRLRDHLARDAALLQRLDRARKVRAALERAALPVLGQVREHREEHEAADEAQRLVEAERVEPGVDRFRVRDAAMPVHRGRADIFGPPEQRLAPEGADYIPQQLAKEANVRVLRDRGRSCGHRLMLHRSDSRVNRIDV